MRAYETVAVEFFKELNAGVNQALKSLFTEMLEARVMKSAVDGGRCPDVGVGQWLGGQISVCSELLEGLMLAPTEGDPQASGEPPAGFPDELQL